MESNHKASDKNNAHKNMQPSGSPMKQIVIFGASGDLAKRKIFPALASSLSKDVQIIAYARSDLASTFHKHLQEMYSYEDAFLDRVKYMRGEYTDLSDLHSYIRDAEDQTIYYFSLPPSVYPTLLSALSGFSESVIGIEKPFGTDEKTFEELLKFKKHKLVFVDHYLIKGMMIALPHLFRKNRLLKSPALDFVKSISGRFCEKIQVENKKYFNTTGVLMDVIQNHMFAVISSIIAILSGYKEDIRDERAKIIKNIKIKEDDCVKAQYEEYAKEMENKSKTETALVLKGIYNDGKRDIPIDVVAGKALAVKDTSVTVEIHQEHFEKLAKRMELKVNVREIKKMEIAFRIMPNDEVVLRILEQEEWKEFMVISSDEVSSEVRTEFGLLAGHSIVFHGLMYGENFPNPSKDEILASWRLFQGVIDKKPEKMVIYPKGIEIDEFVKLCSKK